jgi:hypothetical protein
MRQSSGDGLLGRSFSAVSGQSSAAIDRRSAGRGLSER